MSTTIIMLGGGANPCYGKASHPGNIPSYFMQQKLELSTGTDGPDGSKTDLKLTLPACQEK